MRITRSERQKRRDSYVSKRYPPFSDVAPTVTLSAPTWDRAQRETHRVGRAVPDVRGTSVPLSTVPPHPHPGSLVGPPPQKTEGEVTGEN